MVPSSTPQPHQAHQSPLVQKPSSQSGNMNHKISPSRSPSPSPPCHSESSSVEIILSPPHTSDPSTLSAEIDYSTSPSPSSGCVSPSSFSDIAYIQTLLSASPSVDTVSVPSGSLANISEIQRKTIFVLLDQVPKEPASEQRAKRLKRRLARRAPRYTPAELATGNEAKSWRQQIRVSADALLKAECMNREIRRAKRTVIFPQAFQTVNIHEIANIHENTREVEDESKPVIYKQHDRMEVHLDISSTTRVFAGQIMIQDHISAMHQALSEHTQNGVLRTTPGRHSYHVDAAVSCGNGLTGLAVVNKTSRKEGSPWTARGYRIMEAMDQDDAEAWAIWQALQVVKEKVQDDRTNSRKDSCSVAVIYSDSQAAIQRVAGRACGGEKVAQRIIDCSIELQELDIEVHLHWVPGHKNVPGNELADLVSKKARLPSERFRSSRGEPANRPPDGPCKTAPQQTVNSKDP